MGVAADVVLPGAGTLLRGAATTVIVVSALDLIGGEAAPLAILQQQCSWRCSSKCKAY